MIDESLWDFEPSVNGKSLVEMLRAYQEPLLLYQALKAGVFEALDDSPKSAEALAQKIEAVPSRLPLLLDALVALGLLEKRGDTYANSQVARVFLSSQSRFYLGDLIELQLSPQRLDRWQKVSDWLKGEEIGRWNPQEAFNPSFVRAMAQATLGYKGFGPTVLAVADHPSFRSARRLLDLGGGHGLYAIALKRLRPELEATIFDLPQVEPVAREYARLYGTQVFFVGGDFHQSELPPQQDIVLAFDIFYPSQVETVLAKVYQSLNPGGYLFAKHYLLDSTRTTPKQAALFALQSKLTNPGSRVYTLHEIEEMLLNTGFQLEAAIPAGDSTSTLLVAKKPGGTGV